MYTQHCFKPYHPSMLTSSSLSTRIRSADPLGLTEDTAGPKVPPDIELSGTPTLVEVQRAIKGLSRGTAPGSIAFRKNSSCWVAKCSLGALCNTYKFCGRAVGGIAPFPPRVKILQQWQDADVVTLYKMKGGLTDPGNYRGIFLLDVAGKDLA
jgi:hypothetical protein